MDLNFLKNTRFTGNRDDDGQILTTEDDLANISSRLLNNDGSFNVKRKGSQTKNRYQTLMTASWVYFIGSIAFLFIMLNGAFALVYTLIGVDTLGIESSSFIENYLQSFYFSVQTFTTLGYGRISPISHLTNWVASIEAFIGMMTVAILTGLFFARFSEPKAYIAFSKNILITPWSNNGKSLQFRIVHQVKHKIIDLEARVTITWMEKDNGRIRRKFARLPLQIDGIFLFPLNWTIVHEIDKNSPLYDMDMNDIMSKNAEILVVVKGYDETYSTIVHADRSYQCSDMIYGARFLPMYSIRKNDTVLDLDKLNDYEIYDLETEA